MLITDNVLLIKFTFLVMFVSIYFHIILVPKILIFKLLSENYI